MRIVLATDFSEDAARASAAAVALARCLGDSLAVLHAVETYPNQPGGGAEEIEDASRRLRALAGEARAAGVEVEEHVLLGIPDETLVTAAAELDARLIVAGARGRGKLWDWIAGSVGSRLVETARCPVLLLHDGAQLIERWAAGERPLAILAVATSVELGGLMAPLAALRLARPCDVTFVHVAAGRAPDDGLLALVDRELRARAAGLAGGGKVSARVLLDARLPVDALEALVRAEAFDLVTLEAPRSRGVGHGPMASLAHELLHRGVSPILCAPGSDLAPPRGLGPPFRVILAATDFDELGDRAVAYALALAGATARARAIVCHVAETTDRVDVDLAPELRVAVETRLARGLSRAAGPPASTMEVVAIARRTAADGILEAAERLSVDLICVGSHARGAVGQLVLGSVAAKVAHRSNRPVLIVR